MTVSHWAMTLTAACSPPADCGAAALRLSALGSAVAGLLVALPGFGMVLLWDYLTTARQSVAAPKRPQPRILRGSAWFALLVAATTVTIQLHARDNPEFSRYRGLTLGASVSESVDTLKARSADVKVVQEYPTRIEELTWRQQRYVSGAAVVADPVDELVLTFHRGQLARIAVSYDANRIEGLTDSDLVAAIADVYGAPMLASTSTHALYAAPTHVGAAMGLWSDDDTLVTLRREGSPARLRLTIAAVVADAAMREARVAGAHLAASEEPRKERARRAAAAAASLARAEQVRRDNKASFRP